MPDGLDSFKKRREYAQLLRARFAQEMRDLGARFKRGELSLLDWQLEFRETLRRQEAMMLIAGAGGDKANVKASDWLRLGTELQKQYRYFEQFAADVQAGEAVAIEARSAMYGMSTYASFWRQAVPVKLPAQPGDGSTRCGTNCRCGWDFTYVRNRYGVIIAILARWELHPAEHCPDCIYRSQIWNPLYIAVGDGQSATEIMKELRDEIEHHHAESYSS